MSPCRSTIRARRWALLLPALVLLAACGKVAASTGSRSSPSATPMSLPALKLAVLDAVGGHLSYCDPDLYPVARNQVDAAKARFPTIRQDAAAFAAILAREGFTRGQHFTTPDLIAISDDYKQIQAIDLTPAGTGYRFDLSVPQAGSDVGVWSLSGTVSRSGVVKLGPRKTGQRPSCPVCLAAGALIATPGGPIPVQKILVGMAVWTTDAQGRRVVGVVLRTGHMEAPLGHEVVHLVLSDGRSVTVSPGHPTADGRTVGELRPGDRYDGAVVRSAALAPYTGATWDLLPSGATGTYFADGVLLGSTLASTASAAGIESQAPHGEAAWKGPHLESQ